jgi:hypothetical protein
LACFSLTSEARYVGRVAANGGVSIHRINDQGGVETLAEGDTSPFGLEVERRLRFVCLEAAPVTLRLYVNGILEAEATDADGLAIEAVGVAADSGTDKTVAAVFTDFEVSVE